MVDVKLSSFIISDCIVSYCCKSKVLPSNKRVCRSRDDVRTACISRQQISGPLLTHDSHPKCDVGRREVSRFRATSESVLAAQLILAGLIETGQHRPTWRSKNWRETKLTSERASHLELAGPDPLIRCRSETASIRINSRSSISCPAGAASRCTRADAALRGGRRPPR